jgi:hypothetical protein
VVPFMPVRSVEYELSLVDNLCWNLSNINLMAPILIHMWRTWANLSLDEIERLKSNVIHNTRILKDAHDIPSTFSLAIFDHKKCPTTELKIHTKQDLQIGVGVRGLKYSSALWNIQRPYLRCIFSKDARTGCKGDIMWFDHAIWHMINHLDVFFVDTDFPTLASKFVAFFV